MFEVERTGFFDLCSVFTTILGFSMKNVSDVWRDVSRCAGGEKGIFESRY